MGTSISVQDGRFVDSEGRTLILRGCNLGGDSKVPAIPDGATWRKEDLYAYRDVSFIGRPFPEEEADEHFSRLARWGFTFLRLVFTWEAVEHAGPGVYDESYLAYLRKILKAAERWGISVYMDPHEDAWSRWTGGDGAPAWTLEALGFDLERLHAVGAAFLHQENGDPLPRMVWPTNRNRYAAATLFTLFFAGDTYAPGTTIEGVSAQEWLQSHYIAAIKHSARRLKDCAAIVGWGAMNEPHPGYIGYRDLAGLENCELALGALPSAFQGMAAASGHPTEVPEYVLGLRGARIAGRKLLNPEGLSLFREGFECPWKRAGVWTDREGRPELLKPDHFAQFGGRSVRFSDDFLKPFSQRLAAELREKRPTTLVFLEGVPNMEHPTWKAEDGSDFVNAFHWYDGATLVTKRFVPFFSVRSDTRTPVFGRRAVAGSFVEQLKAPLEWTRSEMGGMPALLGEFGVPFDLNGPTAVRKAFRTGAFDAAEEALSLYYDAVDALLLSSTIWNYSAGNTNRRGDLWNDENLSIWSREAVGPALAAGVPVEDAGARALAGFRRPYAMATAGIPLSMSWDGKRRRFEYRFRTAPSISAPTVVYAPPEAFGGTIEGAVSTEGRGSGEPDPYGAVLRLDSADRKAYLDAEGPSRVLVLRLYPGR